MSHFKDKIEAAQKKLDELRGNVAEMIGMSEAEERDLSDDESLQLEAYATDIEATEKRVTDLERAEKAMAARVVEQEAPKIVKQVGEKERKPGEIFFKMATAKFIAHCEKANPIEVAKTAWPTDQGLQAVLRSAQEPAATGIAGWAAELTDDATRGYQDLLRGESIAAQLWSVAGINLNFEGNNAIKVPSRAGSTTDLASGWTGERDAIPVRSAAFSSQTIYPYKWAAITTTSKELVARSAPSIMQILQTGIVTDTATKLDNDFLGGAALVAGYNPAGIFNGVTGTAASTGGATTGDDMLQDLRNLIQPITEANMGRTLRIVMHPNNALATSLVLYNGTYLFKDELARGMIFGIPVIQSTNAPTDELQIFDMAEIAVAQSAPMVDINDTATVVMVDDDGVAPDMGANYPRSPTSQVGDAARDTVNNPPIRSLWQTESVGIKSVQYLSWHNMRAGSVNRITGVAY